MEIFHKFKKNGAGRWLPPGNQMTSSRGLVRRPPDAGKVKTTAREKRSIGKVLRREGVFRDGREFLACNITLELFDNKLLLGNDGFYQIADGDQADQLAVFQNG